MFISIDELKNTWSLTKVKWANGRSTRFRFYLVALAIFLFNLVSNIVILLGPSKEGSSNYVMVTYDYNPYCLFVILIVTIISVCNYKSTNESYSVYPQTNTSRFLSSQILSYVWVALAAIIALLSYLIHYVLYSIIAANHKNITLVYRFDWDFLITGFFVFLMYAGIISALAWLMMALIRKFKLYAIICFSMIAGLFITRIEPTINLFKNMIGFLLFERNTWIFMAKGALLWVVLFLLSMIVNKGTIYYKSHIRSSKYLMVGIVVSFLFILLVCIPSFLGLVSQQPIADEWPEHQDLEIIIDASGITPGSKVNVVPTNMIDNSDDNDITYTDMSMDLYYEKKSFEHFSGQKIIISYNFPHNIEQSHEITAFANPKLSAYLDGNTLHIDYSYDKDVRLVFMAPWPLMREFDKYKGKNILKETYGTETGGGGGGVQITVE